MFTLFANRVTFTTIQSWSDEELKKTMIEVINLLFSQFKIKNSGEMTPEKDTAIESEIIEKWNILGEIFVEIMRRHVFSLVGKK